MKEWVDYLDTKEAKIKIVDSVSNKNNLLVLF